MHVKLIPKACNTWQKKKHTITIIRYRCGYGYGICFDSTPFTTSIVYLPSHSFEWLALTSIAAALNFKQLYAIHIPTRGTRPLLTREHAYNMYVRARVSAKNGNASMHDKAGLSSASSSFGRYS